LLHRAKFALYFALLIALLPGCRCESSRPAQSPAEEALKFTEIFTGGAEPGEKLPLVIGLHGRGSRPRSFSGLFTGLNARARIVLPEGIRPMGQGYTWFRTELRKGDLRVNLAEMRASAGKIRHLIRQQMLSGKVAGKPVVVGFSQGGMLAFLLAVHHPEAVGLAIPVGGYLPAELRPSSIEKPGEFPAIHAFHGRADRVVTITHAEETVQGLRMLGVDAWLHSFPMVEHRIPDVMRKQLLAKLEEFLDPESGRAEGHTLERIREPTSLPDSHP
jgi:phospholipase/carboxylesterase